MTLFKIGEDLLALAGRMHDAAADGELPPDVAAELEGWFAQLAGEEAAKLDGYVNLIRRLEGEATAADLEAHAYAKMAAVRRSMVARLKGAVLAHLDATGRERTATATGRTIRVQSNGGHAPLSVTLLPEHLPEEFRTVTVAADLSAIRAALAEGRVIDGVAEQPRGRHLRIH